MQSYGTSHLAGDATGRLLVYVPATGECHVLATGIPFANGVGVSKDGSHVIVASTSSYTLFKVATLAAGAAPPAPRVAGDLERFYPGALPGMPDGLTVDDEDGSVFVPIFGPVPLMVRLVDRGPTWLRRLLVAMPYAFRPTKDAVYTMIAKFAPDGTLLRVWHDAEQRYGLLTSVARCEKYLYSGSLKGRHAARFDVSV
jgi:sugar lactone lactonase YvrE